MGSSSSSSSRFPPLPLLFLLWFWLLWLELYVVCRFVVLLIDMFATRRERQHPTLHFILFLTRFQTRSSFWKTWDIGFFDTNSRSKSARKNSFGKNCSETGPFRQENCNSDHFRKVWNLLLFLLIFRRHKQPYQAASPIHEIKKMSRMDKKCGKKKKQTYHRGRGRCLPCFPAAHRCTSTCLCLDGHSIA